MIICADPKIRKLPAISDLGFLARKPRNVPCSNLAAAAAACRRSSRFRSDVTYLVRNLKTKQAVVVPVVEAPTWYSFDYRYSVQQLRHRRLVASR